MNRLYFSLLLPLLLLVCGFKVMPPQQTPEKAAQEAAETWLRLIDSGKYGESWDELAEATKAKVPRDSWKKLGSSATRPSDAEVHNLRQLSTANSNASLPGLPKEAGVMLMYESPSDLHSSGMEIVALVFEAGRGWRVANYIRISSVWLREFSPFVTSSVRAVPVPPSPVHETRGGLGSGDGVGGGPPRLDGSGRNAVATAVDEKPVPLNVPRPRYTEEARKNKIQGTVVVKVLVGADGSVKQVRITRGLPDGLDEQAIQAAYQVRFRPAMKDGNPVAFWQSINIEFNLDR